MFLLMGSGRKTKKNNFIGYRYLNNAGAILPHYLAVNYSYFSLFFIPLFKFNKKYYVVAGEEMNYALEITKEDFLNLQDRYHSFISIDRNKELFQAINLIISSSIDEELTIEHILSKLNGFEDVLKEYLDLFVDTLVQLEIHKRNSFKKAESF